MRQWQNIFRSHQLPPFDTSRENLTANHVINTEGAKSVVCAEGRERVQFRISTLTTRASLIHCGCMSA